jgi:hypothetical protein
MKRADLIACLKHAGATGDKKTFTRLYCENRISRAVADKAWSDGVAFGKFCRERDAKSSSGSNGES